MHYYYNDQRQLLTETIEVDDVETVYAIYHWHPFYIDALATRMRASSTHFFLHDANFNVTAAVDDSTDAVVERYNYTPYGTPTVLDANFAADSDNISDIANTHLYTGRERDPESGLQLNRHRYYASHLGRWLTRDPIGYVNLRTNFYEYNFGMPLVFTDELGLFPGYPNHGAAGGCGSYGCTRPPKDPPPYHTGPPAEPFEPWPPADPPETGFPSLYCHYYNNPGDAVDDCKQEASDAYDRCLQTVADDFDCDSKPAVLRPLCDQAASAVQSLECLPGYGIYQTLCDMLALAN